MFDGYLTELWIVLLELSPALIPRAAAGRRVAGVFPRRPGTCPSEPADAGQRGARADRRTRCRCSCGVVPTTIGLRNQGASRGATTSFLISTPQTGSIRSWSARPFSAGRSRCSRWWRRLSPGGGWLAGQSVTDEGAPVAGDDEQGEHWRAAGNRLTAVLRYALFDILAAIDLWLIAGILLAAAITTAVPPDYFQHVAWSQGLPGMFLVLAIALPDVCLYHQLGADRRVADRRGYAGPVRPWCS